MSRGEEGSQRGRPELVERGLDGGFLFLCHIYPDVGPLTGDGVAPHLQNSENPLPLLAGRCRLWKGPSRQGNSLCESLRQRKHGGAPWMAGEAGGLKSGAGEQAAARWGLGMGTQAHLSLPPALPSSPPLPRLRTQTLLPELLQPSPKQPASLQGPHGDSGLL